MNDTTSARDKAKALRDDLAAEKEEKQEQEVQNKEEAMKALELVQANPALKAFYSSNAKVGTENLGGVFPYLRLHTPNSNNNVLANGNQPAMGSYFYAPSKEEFAEVYAHILTISKGFYVNQPQKDGTFKKQYNQIIAGAIVDSGELKPFFMYVNGMKLRPMWDFGKEANEFTRKGIPMFCMTVKLTSTTIKTEEYGSKYVPVFTIEKEQGFPILEQDIDLLNLLKENAIKATENIQSIIDRTGVTEEAVEVIQGETAEEVVEPTTNEVDPEQIPF